VFSVLLMVLIGGGILVGTAVLAAAALGMASLLSRVFAVSVWEAAVVVLASGYALIRIVMAVFGPQPLPYLNVEDEADEEDMEDSDETPRLREMRPPGGNARGSSRPGRRRR
jgi:hypothetical protein